MSVEDEFVAVCFSETLRLVRRAQEFEATAKDRDRGLEERFSAYVDAAAIRSELAVQGVKGVKS